MADESSNLIHQGATDVPSALPTDVNNNTNESDDEKEKEKENEEEKGSIQVEMIDEKKKTLSNDIAASLMKVLHDEEVSDDTEEDEAMHDSILTDDEEEESSFGFDLMDEEGLDEMHQHRITVRDELKKMHDENNPLWTLMSSRSMGIKSRRNVFHGIHSHRSRDPVHNALIGAATAAVVTHDNEDEKQTEADTKEEDTNDGEEIKDNKISNKPHILSLETTDFLAAEAELDVPSFATLNDNKSATIRAIDTITQKSKTQLHAIEEEKAGGSDMDADEVSVALRIWYIVRCLVVIYLYVLTLFEFAFLYKRDYRAREYIGLFIANWICDVLLWMNLWHEYLHYRDDIEGSWAKKMMDERNETDAQLDAMRNATKLDYKHRKDLEGIIRSMRSSPDAESETDANGTTDGCLNKCISKYFDDQKSESFKLYRLSHKLRFDFVVNFPFDIIVLIIWSNSPYFIIARLLKLLHSRRFFEYFNAAFCDWIPDKGVMRSAFVSRLARLIVTGIAWLHLWSCIWFFVGSNLYIGEGSDYTGDDAANDTWLTAYYSRIKHDESTIHAHMENEEYLWSIYFVTVTFSTVGYGDIVPMNYFEMALLIIFQSINYIFITIFVAELAPVIEEFCFRQLSKATQHRMLRNFFASMHIALPQQDKLLEANRYRWRHQYGMEEDEILNELPRSLSIEMKYQFLKLSLLSFIRHIIEQSMTKIDDSNLEKRTKLSALQPEQLIPAGLLRKIANECQPKTYVRDQVILSENVENDLLYLLIDGKVKRTADISTEQEALYIDNYPNRFGHESFWKASTKSQYTYTAQTMVCLFVISSKQFRAILAPHPTTSELFTKIFKMAYPTVDKSIHNDMETLRRRDALLVENAANENDNQCMMVAYKYTSLVWDVLNAFCIMFQAYTFVWGIAFFSIGSNFTKTPYKGPLIMNWIIDALFVADIVLSACGSRIKIVYFYPSRPATTTQRDRMRTANLITDIVCCIPFELALLIFHRWYTTYIYLLRIAKFTRIRYIAASWESWKELLGIIHIRSEFTKIIVFFISIMHVFACIWYLIGSVSLAKDENVNWIRNDEAAIQETDDSISITRSLLRSYYFVLVTLTTIGYGGIVPFSLIEQLYGVVLVVSGSIFYWVLISWFTVRASHRQETRIEHTNLVTATEFLLQKQHPSYVQQNRLYQHNSDAKQQKEKDQKQNDELMARLQNYFDFVLHQREGAVSFWDGKTQKPLLQALLRYQLLTTAFDAKKANDPSRYRFLEWIPDETMLQFAQHLEWIVVCKGQSIKIKQSGANSLVLFLVTGTLWSPYSKYVFTRHTKQVNRESEINKSNIITFNVECLSPVHMNRTLRKYKTEDMNLMQTMSTYLQIDVDPNAFPALYETLNGLYEITSPSAVKFNHNATYQVIYQQIPPDQQQRRLQTEIDHEWEIEDLDEVKEMDRTLILLVYTKIEGTTADAHLGTIQDNQQYNQSADVDANDVASLLGKWIFMSIERKDGVLHENTTREIASYPLTGLYIDAKEIPSDGWTIKEDESGVISISDELHFEALECCDVVQLRQSDVLESFQTFYSLRFEQYLEKAKKMGRGGLKRGSILSPRLKRPLKEEKPSNDNLATLIMNDGAFAQNKSRKNIHKLKSIQSSHKTLPQFDPISAGGRRDILLRQETLINSNATTTQHLHAKDVIERFRTEEHVGVGSRSVSDNHDINTAWVEQVEAIVFDDEHRILKIIWYFVGLSLIATSQFVLPMRALFGNYTEFLWFWFDIVSQIYFIFDLYVEWKLFKKREKQRQSKKIRKSLFVLDFVLAIPWTFLGLLWSWKHFYFFRLIDLLRIKGIKMYWNGLRHELVHYTGKIISIHAGLAAVIYHIFALFLLASYCACAWYIIGITQDRFQGEAASDKTWVTQVSKPVYYSGDALSENTTYYSLSIYWAMASMSSVGYGDLKPISWTETVFALIALPCMVLFYIQFMGDMASFAGNIERSTKTAFYEKFSHTLLALNRRIEYLELYAVAESKQLIDLKKTIRKYLLSLWKERAGMSESEIYSSLPYFLTRDIAYQCRKKYLHSIPCLTRLIESESIDSIELCKTIARKLQHHIITRKDELPLEDVYVIETGDIGLCEIGARNSKQATHIELQNVRTEKKLIDIPAPEEEIEEEEEKKEGRNIISGLFDKMNSSTYRKTECARFDVYLPPKANHTTQYKLQCHSNLASIYCLPREILFEIQMGYDEAHENNERIERILENYWYDVHKLNVSNVIQTQTGDDNNENDDNNWSSYASPKSKSTHGTLLCSDDEEDVIEYKSFYYLLYNPKRKILRRSHPFRLHWDLLCSFALFLYALILPLQISNVFYTKSSMLIALVVSSVIDIIFMIDFIFRLWFAAPHPIKKLDPFYVMTGQYIDDHRGDSLKRKYISKLGGGDNVFGDLPQDAQDVLPLYKFVFEILAMIPLNLFAIIFMSKECDAYVYCMNVYFRLNKLIYLVLCIANANQSLNHFIANRRINLLSARIFRISIVTLVVLHWMSCIWLQLAEFDDIDAPTWLNQMDPKRVSISTWSESPAYAYLLSLYFVAVTMTTTGYGDITPVTRNEITMTNLLIILGDTLMALMAGVFVQYISSINKPSLDIAIKERSITHYLDARSNQIIRNCNISDENDLKKVKKSFKKLIRKVKRYFAMQLDYQHRVSTIRSLTQHLPLYYRMKLLHTLFQTLFRRYPLLYNNKNLYFRLLDNVQEQIYTYWHDDDSFEFIVDPQQSQIMDFMIVQFGECLVYERKEWRNKSKHAKKPKLKKKGDLIGFRSLVLQNSANKNEKIRKKLFRKEKPKCVITPTPTHNKMEKFKIVSILRIKQNVWNQIINEVFVEYDEKMKFEQEVQKEFKSDI